MRDSGGEAALIKDFSDADNYLDKEINSQQKDNKKRNMFILISIIVIVIVVIIIVVLILTLLNDDNEPDPDSDKEEEKTDPMNEIDTIPKEEMNKARNSFKQYKYIDTVNNSYSLDYNLFIPTNYIKKNIL